ncbi:MAG: hypothetical protein KIS78_35905, partial [Labilithrix sp.]|nr:hypothetical protein [Labilithrix sp.]
MAASAVGLFPAQVVSAHPPQSSAQVEHDSPGPQKPSPHPPQSCGQLFELSPTSQVPFPQEQSCGKLRASSPAPQTPFPHVQSFGQLLKSSPAAQKPSPQPPTSHRPNHLRCAPPVPADHTFDLVASAIRSRVRMRGPPPVVPR